MPPQKAQSAPDFIPYKGDAPDFIPADAPDFIPAEEPPAPPQKIQPPPAPTASMSAAPNRGVTGWLDDAESDLREGGNRTLIGRGLGFLQGRGSKGYSGLESGTSPGAAAYMGSPILGPVHAAQGIAETPQHPLLGPLKAVGGALETATIPASFIAPEAAEAVGGKIANLIPSTERAGAMLDTVKNTVGDKPVTLTRSLPLLERAQQLSERGHGTITPLDNLYKRINTVNPIDYSEARDRYSALSNLSGEDKLRGSRTLQSAVKKFTHAYKDDIGDTASQGGVGNLYQRGMSEYARAARNKELIENAKEAIAQHLPMLQAVGAGAAYGLYRSLKH